METDACGSQDQVSQGPRTRCAHRSKDGRIFIEELQEPVKHPRTQRLREQLRDILIIAQDTGMRPSEILRIRIEHIDWSAKRIWNPYGKTDKARRFVGMSERMETVLSVGCGQQHYGWLFPSTRSKSGHVNSIAVGFRALRRRTGVSERIAPYNARHIYGTHALEATGNTITVADSMGRANVQSMKPYQHTRLDPVRDAINCRNQEIGSHYVAENDGEETVVNDR